MNGCWKDVKIVKIHFSLMICLLFCLNGCTAAPVVQQEGIQKLYYADGILKSVWEIRDGKKNGIQRNYTSDGTIQTVTMYVDDKINGMRNIYYPDGVLWKKEMYVEGILENIKEYDEEGFIIREGNLK